MAETMMTELLGDEDFLLLSKSLSEFSERELVPYLRTLGRENFPARFISLAGQNGFLGTAIPTEYGGQGGTLESLLPVLEGIAACDGSLALTLAAHESLATTHIFLGASNDQKRKYLPELTSGRKIAAWCLTEPQAGSNIFNDMRTRLVRIGKGWNLSGEKTFITNGCHADIFVVLARAIDEAGRHAGLTACIVEKQGSEGRIHHTSLHDKMGMNRSDTAALKFEDVAVADDAILMPLGSAEQVARRVLLRGRVGIGALALGLARDSLQRAESYAKERKVAGGTLFDQPLTRAKLARMEESLSVAWQAVRSAAQRADQRKPVKVQAAMAKVFATETALRITDETVQILGGYGYMGDYKVERNYRDARLLTIGEGASEILRLAIARGLLDESGVREILPPLERLHEAVGPYRGSMEALWGPAWRALQLASESVHLVREYIIREGLKPDSIPTWQPQAAALADLATKLWVEIQVILAGTALVNRGRSSQKRTKLVRAFVAECSIAICHQASELLRTLGLTDATLCGNYIEALQAGAALNAPSPTPAVSPTQPESPTRASERQR